jgi:hypothetical protein
MRKRFYTNFLVRAVVNGFKENNSGSRLKLSISYCWNIRH